MSHSSGYRAACANYQACHLKSARILDNSSSRNVFTPRCLEMDNNRTCSARTSLSVGEEPLHSRRDDIDPILAGCGSQVGATYFTKYLELKVAKIQEQHQRTQSENAQLNNQLSRATARNRQLEEKNASLEEALLREKRQRELAPISTHQRPSIATVHQGVNTSATSLLKDASTSSSESAPLSHADCAVQTPIDATMPLDLVSISRSELATLENDMRNLREAVRAKEEMWEQAMERERNYREHWARLSRELITVRQQLDSREPELKMLERKLSDQTEELKAAQKELSFTKKQLQKNRRDSAGSNNGPTTPEYMDSHYSKHESPRHSPVSKFRSNKTSTKDARGTTTTRMQQHSSRDRYSPRYE